MNRIFITGDTHGLRDVRSINTFIQKNPDLNKDDILFIAGDWGAIWGNHPQSNFRDLKYFSKLPFTIAIVLGNHENFNAIEQYPDDIWNQAKVKRITNNIVIIKHGEILNILGKTFWCFGGAESIDKASRRDQISWWPQEVPNQMEMNYGIETLKKLDYKVDFVITHTCPKRNYPALYEAGQVYFNNIFYTVEKYLEYISSICYFDKWIHGHHHIDRYYEAYGDKYYAVYNKIIQLI